ncbi:MAG TPA: Rieske (2Fe-2S) protein [Actinomycetota bacterium]|nr:Rieske (2Fe-2S) protein [Actinomycetota bacterium]
MNGDGWTSVIEEADLPEARAVAVEFGDARVLLYRSGERLFAIGNRCTHQGAPLHRGPIRVVGSVATVTCPAHGSIFGLEDGAIKRGPAREPVPAFDARVASGMIELRARD